MNPMVTVIESMTKFLWGDLLRIPLPGGSSIGLSLMVLLLIPAGIFYTIRTRILPLRLFPEMISVLLEKQEGKDAADPASGRLSGMQALIVSTATRVGMGNLVGVVAAISAGGAGAVFWMWVTAIIGASTRLLGWSGLLHSRLLCKAARSGGRALGGGDRGAERIPR